MGESNTPIGSAPTANGASAVRFLKLTGVTVLSPELATNARLRFEVRATLTGSSPTVISEIFTTFLFVVEKTLKELLSVFTLTSRTPSSLCAMGLD